MIVFQWVSPYVRNIVIQFWRHNGKKPCNANPRNPLGIVIAFQFLVALEYVGPSAALWFLSITTDFWLIWYGLERCLYIITVLKIVSQSNKSCRRVPPLGQIHFSSDRANSGLWGLLCPLDVQDNIAKQIKTQNMMPTKPKTRKTYRFTVSFADFMMVNPD